MTTDGIERVTERMRAFSDARDWGRFHTPKNLVMALSGEVGELTEIFQWLTPAQAAVVMEGERAEDVRDELADVFNYLVRLADILGIDLAEASMEKMDRNDLRFPAEAVRGRADIPAGLDLDAG